MKPEAGAKLKGRPIMQRQMVLLKNNAGLLLVFKINLIFDLLIKSTLV
jgi:hypothetical protein